MICTHIVEYLRTKGIQPIAYASTEIKGYEASIALIYDKNKNFNTNHENIQQWWAVDFRKTVLITGYYIEADSYSDWICQWNLSVSINNRTWGVVDAPDQGYPTGRTFQLNRAANARYVRINGSAPLDTNHGTTTGFGFYFIKFFGSMNPMIAGDTCNKNRSNNHDMLAFLFMILIFTYTTK